MALSNSRSAIAKRLKRRGILESAKGVPTAELERLWETYQDSPVLRPVEPAPEQSNFERVKTILDNFVEQYEDYFIGWYKDAWRYLPEIAFFWQRLDVEKINNDPNFVPKTIDLYFMPPSDWAVNERDNIAPEDIPDYLFKLYEPYVL